MQLKRKLTVAAIGLICTVSIVTGCSRKEPDQKPETPQEADTGIIAQGSGIGAAEEKEPDKPEDDGKMKDEEIDNLLEKTYGGQKQGEFKDRILEYAEVQDSYSTEEYSVVMAKVYDGKEEDLHEYLEQVLYRQKENPFQFRVFYSDRVSDQLKEMEISSLYTGKSEHEGRNFTDIKIYSAKDSSGQEYLFIYTEDLILGTG